MWPRDTVYSNLSRDILNHELPSLSPVSIMSNFWAWAKKIKFPKKKFSVRTKSWIKWRCFILFLFKFNNEETYSIESFSTKGQTISKASHGLLYSPKKRRKCTQDRPYIAFKIYWLLDNPTHDLCKMTLFLVLSEWNSPSSRKASCMSLISILSKVYYTYLLAIMILSFTHQHFSI